MKPTRNNSSKHFCHVFLIFICRFFVSLTITDSELRWQREEKKIVKQKKEICMLKRGSNFKSHKLFLSFVSLFNLRFISNANSFVSIHDTFFPSFTSLSVFSVVLSVLSINLKAWKQARRTKIND